MKILKKGWRELFEPVHRLLDIAMAAGKFEYAAGISDAMDVLETTIRYIEMFGEEVWEEPKGVGRRAGHGEVLEELRLFIESRLSGRCPHCYHKEMILTKIDELKTQPVYTGETWPLTCGHNIIRYGPAYECDTCGREVPEKCEWRKLALDYLESLEGAK